MKIANIFGLHLGCMAHCKNLTRELTGKIVRVDTGWLRLDSDIAMFELSDCKLLLKPLSAITDEDKDEFMEKFYPADSIFWRYMRIVSFGGSRLNVYSTRRQESNSVAYTYQQALFLSTKGYKIEGIVPDEYCEVDK